MCCVGEDDLSINEIETEKININDKEESSDDIKNINTDIFDDDMDIELFIGDNNYDIIDDNNIEENDYKIPFKKIIKNRLNEEKKKIFYNAKKRKNLDIEEDSNNKNNKIDLKCKKKYPK